MDLHKAQVYEQSYSWIVTLFSNTGGATAHESIVCSLRGVLESGGLSLSDINISEEELEELRVEACRKEAKLYLSFFSCYDPIYENFAAYDSRIRRALKSGGLSLSDINISEEELTSLVWVRA